MYTLLLNNDFSFTHTVKQVLMQHSSLTDGFHIIVPKTFKDLDMTGFTCTMEYVMPISRKYHTDILTAQEEIYKEEYIEFKIPLTSRLSEEAGEIDLKLTFSKVELDEEGQKLNYLIHTKDTSILITPITNWSNIIPDDALSALDNRILAIDGQIKAINEIQNSINSSIPDDLQLTDDLLQLTRKGDVIGEGVRVFAIDDDYVSDDANDGSTDGIIDIDSLLIEIGG